MTRGVQSRIPGTRNLAVVQYALRVGRAKNKKRAQGPFSLLAEWTGLEPATPGVTGRYSNQLNYHSINRQLTAKQTPTGSDT